MEGRRGRARPRAGSWAHTHGPDPEPSPEPASVSPLRTDQASGRTAQMTAGAPVGSPPCPQARGGHSFEELLSREGSRRLWEDEERPPGACGGDRHFLGTVWRHFCCWGHEGDPFFLDGQEPSITASAPCQAHG